MNYQRKLLIHTAHHNAKTLFADGLDNYFVTRDSSAMIGFNRCEQVVTALSSYFDNSKIDKPWKCDITPNSIDFSRGSHNEYLLFHGWGGGCIGFNVFNYLDFAPPVKSYVSTKLQTLPNYYNAVHFRHTDYKSNPDELWDTIKTMTELHLPLYLATDSQGILDEANARYPGVILNICRNLSTTTNPIHQSSLALKKIAIYDMFTDLAILCFAQSLHCTRLSNPSVATMPYSGFCILANSMRNLKKTSLKSLFSLAESTLNIT